MTATRSRPPATRSTSSPPRVDRQVADLAGFFAATAAIWATARAEGRDWLSWEQWQAWGKAAVAAKLVRVEHLTGAAGEPPARYTGYPTEAAFWHVAIVRTWRRVQEARALSRADESYTALQFHRDEQAAIRADAERLAERDRVQIAERAAAIAQMNSRGNRKHSGAAGEL